jgi:hypothetical protein
MRDGVAEATLYLEPWPNAVPPTVGQGGQYSSQTLEAGPEWSTLTGWT